MVYEIVDFNTFNEADPTPQAKGAFTNVSIATALMTAGAMLLTF